MLQSGGGAANFYGSECVAQSTITLSDGNNLHAEFAQWLVHCLQSRHNNHFRAKGIQAGTYPEGSKELFRVEGIEETANSLYLEIINHFNQHAAQVDVVLLSTANNLVFAFVVRR